MENSDRRQQREQYALQWKHLEEKFHSLVASTKLVPEIKWGTTIYTLNGKNIVAFGGFKNFGSIWFYDGVLLSDPLKVLVNASEGKTKALRQWRFFKDDEFKSSEIKKYIQEAIKLSEKGITVLPERNTPPEPSGLLKEYLKKDKKFQLSFDKLTAGRQKEYIEYIESAKREETRLSRIEKIIPMVIAGTGLYDKYKK